MRVSPNWTQNMTTRSRGRSATPATAIPTAAGALPSPPTILRESDGFSELAPGNANAIFGRGIHRFKALRRHSGPAGWRSGRSVRGGKREQATGSKKNNKHIFCVYNSEFRRSIEPRAPIFASPFHIGRSNNVANRRRALASTNADDWNLSGYALLVKAADAQDPAQAPGRRDKSDRATLLRLPVNRPDGSCPGCAARAGISGLDDVLSGGLRTFEPG